MGISCGIESPNWPFRKYERLAWKFVMGSMHKFVSFCHREWRKKKTSHSRWYCICMCWFAHFPISHHFQFSWICILQRYGTRLTTGVREIRGRLELVCVQPKGDDCCADWCTRQWFPRWIAAQSSEKQTRNGRNWRSAGRPHVFAG